MGDDIYDISGLSIIDVVKALWEAQSPASHYLTNGTTPPPFDENHWVIRREMKDYYEGHRASFEYVCGRAIKICIRKPETVIDLFRYNMIAGHGVGHKALDTLKAKQVAQTHTFKSSPPEPGKALIGSTVKADIPSSDKELLKHEWADTGIRKTMNMNNMVVTVGGDVSKPTDKQMNDEDKIVKTELIYGTHGVICGIKATTAKGRVQIAE